MLKPFLQVINMPSEILEKARETGTEVLITGRIVLPKEGRAIIVASKRNAIKVIATLVEEKRISPEEARELESRVALSEMTEDVSDEILATFHASIAAVLAMRRQEATTRQQGLGDRRN